MGQTNEQSTVAVNYGAPIGLSENDQSGYNSDLRLYSFESGFTEFAFGSGGPLRSSIVPAHIYGSTLSQSFAAPADGSSFHGNESNGIILNFSVRNSDWATSSDP